MSIHPHTVGRLREDGPDEGMAAFDSDKVIKHLASEEVHTIKEWRKDFFKPFDKGVVAKEGFSFDPAKANQLLDD